MQKGRGNGESPRPESCCVRQKGGLSRRAQHLFTLRPIARAKLVRLERVEDPQRLLRVAAHVQAVDRHVLDDVVGIDDEGCAERDALFFR